MENFFGYLAGFCTTVAFIPQVLLVIRTNDTRSISLGMYCLFTFGIAMWLTYGIQQNDYAMIISNIITVTLASVVLGYKIKNYGSDKKDELHRQKRQLEKSQEKTS